ncbi:MAG: hypothetical protein F6K58_15420, partial [Symploca sp. SIO2E9]|nr:hypothetical protein [Symploca sp. SIO2E9]
MPLLAQDCQESQKALSKIVAKTWLDEDFNSQFLSNTTAVLEENGLSLPSGVEYTVQQNTLLGIKLNNEVVCEIPLPVQPASLTDIRLQSLVDGDR